MQQLYFTPNLEIIYKNSTEEMQLCWSAPSNRKQHRLSSRAWLIARPLGVDRLS